MKLPYYLSLSIVLITAVFIPQFSWAQALGASTQEIIAQFQQLGLENKQQEALSILNKGLEDKEISTEDRIHLNTYKLGLLLESDSLRQASLLLEGLEQDAQTSKDTLSQGMIYRARANMHAYLNEPDSALRDAKDGLALLEDLSQEAYNLKYWLYYQIYAIYSSWDDEQKMAEYIAYCEQQAELAGNLNYKANVLLGRGSAYLARYRKQGDSSDLDSNYFYLNKAYELFEAHPGKISSNTFVVVCINLANYQLEFAKQSLAERQRRAFAYLDQAEKELLAGRARASRWVNLYGIKSDFASRQGNYTQAEALLLEGLSHLDAREDSRLLRLEYAVYTHLVSLAEKKGDFKAALTYQKRGEQALKSNFNQEQIANAQKLEVQFETQKKDQQLALLSQSASFRQTLNYLYGGLALLAILGLLFMFLSYHFKLRYSIERERKLEQEKQEEQQRVEMELKLEKEERARLKAEQELLSLKTQQLEKEALANSMIIKHKNETLKQIKEKLSVGGAADIQKLLREETLLNADFEDVKFQITQVHPEFFNQLSQHARQKLTPLDQRYCTYIYLQMSTKQIAQVLHVEAQSVRMFKYRLKQKFSLGKDQDLERFLQEIGRGMHAGANPPSDEAQDIGE